MRSEREEDEEIQVTASQEEEEIERMIEEKCAVNQGVTLDFEEEFHKEMHHEEAQEVER